MPANLREIVDNIAGVACVMSVERLDNDSYGTIRIAEGNRAYIDSIENPPQGMDMLTDKFIPNSEYTRYLTKDLNLEEHCYRSAVKKECLRAYVHPDRFDAWLNITFIPLDRDEGNLSYCIYKMDVDYEPQAERVADVRADIASRVLECAIKLRSSNDVERTMPLVVDDIRTMCLAEYCCILLVNEDSRTCSVLAEGFAEGSALKPMNAYLDNAFYEIVESWESTIAGSYCLIAKDEHDMNVVKQRNPRWYESLVGASIQNIVLFPLKSRGKLLGYIWAVNFQAEKSTLVRESLELATYILATEIDNYLLVRDLREMGSHDLLTGVMNRNEMNRLVESLAAGEVGAGRPLGVVYADLNGLKAVNDGAGHAAGDRLLQDAVKVLVGAFGPQVVFRAGGDEFVVIVQGASEAELADRMATVRELSKRYERVSFALGCCVVPDGTRVNEALRGADVRMYEDKAAFYAHKA